MLKRGKYWSLNISIKNDKQQAKAFLFARQLKNNNTNNYLSKISIKFIPRVLYRTHMQSIELYIPRYCLPFNASTHVSAASYKALRSSVMLCRFFSFFDTKYIAAAPLYFAKSLSVKLKLPGTVSNLESVPTTLLPKGCLCFHHCSSWVMRQINKNTIKCYMHIVDNCVQPSMSHFRFY